MSTIQHLWRTHWPALCAAAFVVAALWPLVPSPGAAAAPAAAPLEWPMQWEGRLLRPLALGNVEARFAARFPGAIGRFAAGGDVLVLRQVTQPTRMLHPAADCFRGLGHRIESERLERRADGRLWRCFEAVSPGGERLRVCERIESLGGDGTSFVDASAWFWAAVLGRSRGPWQAVTVVEAS